ncbi:Hpt domain-containing protein [Sphingomonas sp. Mn802worker]|uniref:Hpt domain-containing protein n=1 Tax=Sphingomonas sp. Mn802worker TaxID=629773 RepID=UPI0003736306|nr:Hpt domain-containing protein [Sphingomonas sp. Mn802worker]
MTVIIDPAAIDLGSAPLIDPAQLRDYAEFLPGAQVLQLIRTFIRELETRPSMVLHLARQGDLANARAAAHFLKGAALSIGARRIALLADQVEHAGDDAIVALAQELPACALDTLGELETTQAVLRDDA